MAEACCTCATLLENISPPYDEKTEKPSLHNRLLPCCERVICSNCLQRNARFNAYCPFCQITVGPTSLTQGLKDPPPYTLSSGSKETSGELSQEEALPAYSTLNSLPVPSNEKQGVEPSNEDVLHFLNHNQDTLYSLSLRYGVPIDVLRKVNNITSDHLLLARRTILIPGEYYKGGISLNPRPVEGEEEEIRKSKVRKFQVACKASDFPSKSRYDVALLYLQEAEYDLEQAIEAYRDDERWEKEHPIEAPAKGKGKLATSIGRRRFTGQQS